MEPKKHAKQGWNPRNVENKNNEKQQEARITKVIALWKLGPWSELARGVDVGTQGLGFI